MKNTIKITAKEGRYILGSKSHKTDVLMHYEIQLSESSAFVLRFMFSWPAYILLFVPALVIEFFNACWNYGLKNFAFFHRCAFECVIQDTGFDNASRFARGYEIINKHYNSQT